MRLFVVCVTVALCATLLFAQEDEREHRMPAELEHALRIVKVFEPELIREFHEAKEEGKEEEVRELIREIFETAKHYEREAIEFLKRDDMRLFKRLMHARKEEDRRLYNDILFDALRRLCEAMESEEEAEEREREREEFEGEEGRGRECPREGEEREREREGFEGEEEREVEEALRILKEFDPEFVERLKESENDDELRERMLREAVMRARELRELKERDPRMFELSLAERKLKRRIEEVTFKYHSTDNEGHKKELERELGGLLERLFDVKMKQQAHQIERLAKELEHLKRLHQKHKENRERIIRRRLGELLGKERGEDFDW